MDPRHVVNLSGKEFVLYVGLLAEAHGRGLQSIQTQLLQLPVEENGHTAIAKAIVTMKDGTVFEEFGDASPQNVNTSPRVRLDRALPRMALTRAKGRALRDAVNVGVTMFEELPGLADERAVPSGADGPEGRENRAAADAPPVCEVAGCGVILTPGQVTCSWKRFGRRLCPTHQRQETQE